MIFVCKWDLDDELYNSAYGEEFKHEIIEGVEEESPIGRHLGGRLEVWTEELCTLLEVARGQSLIHRCVQLLNEFLGSYFYVKSN